MKLKDTITEQAFRKELMASRTRLFNDISMRKFLNIIRQNFPVMRTAFILYWIPEQGEDIITFLVDTHSVISIELDRYDTTIAPVIEVFPIDFWIKGRSKASQIKIAVALDLANDPYLTY